jgi:2-(1,2-epoxy-1,2-dihydrophenyl)acetyl-CoA isomerase
MSAVLLDRDGAVATVTLNRPGSRNSLDTALKSALVEALTDVDADDSVRAVVLAGAGGHFCVGQDLAEHAHGLHADPSHAFDTVSRHYTPITLALATMPKPVVAAVEGSCVGAGLGFALACDVRVFASDAKLATAFTGIGLTCDSGLSHTLPRAVGAARAQELVLLGRPFSAEDAVAWGISGTIAEPGEVLDAARAIAVRLAAGPTAAYAETKRLLADSWDRDLETQLKAEGEAQVRLGATDDHAGAVKAFIAKERPTFTGR